MLHSIVASQIFDSRGNPTVRVVVTTDKGLFEAQVPSGASKGSYEAHELRDGGKAYGGQGVLKAVESVNMILAPALLKSDIAIDEQRRIDDLLCQLDGTEQKSKLGANAILGVSMACARAGAAAKEIELFEYIAQIAETLTDVFVLPVPFMNQINGGVHSGNTLAPQEFMVAPVGAKSFSQAMQMNSEIYHCLKELIIEQSGKASTGLGDEGGFAPPLTTFEQALGLLESATSKAGYTSGHSNDVVFGVDPASVEFYNSKDKTYNLGFKMGNDDKSQQKGLIKTGTEMHEIYTSLLAEYPIALLEDPFAEDDFDSWRDFCSTVDAKVELVGDDLLATNPKRIQMAAKEKLCNSLLLKINQIGTITEAIESANLAMSHGWAVFVSHRSGETVDDFIADLTVGLGCGHLKSGAPARGERLAKYNRLLAIEDILERRSKKAGRKMHKYAGHKFRHPRQ